MSYRVLILPRAQRSLAALSGASYERVKAAIFALSEDPRPPGSRKLAGRNGCRIRVGDYRVIYEIDDPSREVTILDVGHRRDVYR